MYNLSTHIILVHTLWYMEYDLVVVKITTIYLKNQGMKSVQTNIGANGAMRKQHLFSVPLTTNKRETKESSDR